MDLLVSVGIKIKYYKSICHKNEVFVLQITIRYITCCIQVILITSM